MVSVYVVLFVDNYIDLVRCHPVSINWTNGDYEDSNSDHPTTRDLFSDLRAVLLEIN